MDLTIPIDNHILNIRFLVLIRSEGRYVFEQDKEGYYFGIGGRIKIGESSREAALREIKEEPGVDISEIKNITVIENFFDNVHEICFVYICDDIKSDRINRRPFATFDKSELLGIDLRPEILKKIILNEDGLSNYIVSR